MARFTGIGIATVFVSVIMPTIIGISVLKAVDIKQPEQYTPDETIISDIESFVVDYDMFGDYVIGGDTIRCEINNNSDNVASCDVYLTDMDGNKISEVQTIKPSNSVLVLHSSMKEDTPGTYDAKLLYEVYTGDQVSIIECPYTVLINGGI